MKSHQVHHVTGETSSFRDHARVTIWGRTKYLQYKEMSPNTGNVDLYLLYSTEPDD